MKEMKIVEWTERPWNPVTGCDKISSGCANCYAKELAEGCMKRWKNPRYLNGFNLTLHDDLLEFSPSINWSDNIWLGVTVEEARYVGRIEQLKLIPAANKFVCAEPLLGDLGELDLQGIDWLVAGGESGRDSRPCNESWVIQLRDQCLAQGVAFTFKQWGGRFRKRNGSLLQGQYYHEMPVSNLVRIYNGK